MALGWYRIRGVCTDVPPGFEAYGAWIKADSCVASQTGAVENELDAEQTSGEQTLHVDPFGSLPILILSRAPEVLLPNWPAQVGRDNTVVWNQMQEESKNLSTQTRRIIAKGSDHYVQIDRADLVEKEVTSLVLQMRAHQESADYSHTTIEE